MLKTDCFASGVNGRCGIIDRTSCDGCKFYKTSERFRADFKKSKQHLIDKGLLDSALTSYKEFEAMCGRIG